MHTQRICTHSHRYIYRTVPISAVSTVQIGKLHARLSVSDACFVELIHQFIRLPGQSGLDR